VAVVALPESLPEFLPEMLPFLPEMLPAVGSGRLKPRLRALRAAKSGQSLAPTCADWGEAGVWRVGRLLPVLPFLLPELLPWQLRLPM
jgi:hypothetical protein